MDLFEQRLFEGTFGAAMERFTERIVQRNEGMDRALDRIKTDPEGEGIWLSRFVAQFFADELLDNTAGAVYVLCALERRPIEAVEGGKIGDVLLAMAQRAFAELLRAKTIESLEQGVAYSA